MICDKTHIERELKKTIAVAKSIFKNVITAHSGLAMIHGINGSSTIKDGSKIFKQITYPANGIDSNSVQRALFKSIKEPSDSQDNETGSGDGTTSATLFAIDAILHLGNHLGVKDGGLYDGYDALFTYDPMSYCGPITDLVESAIRPMFTDGDSKILTPSHADAIARVTRVIQSYPDFNARIPVAEVPSIVTALVDTFIHSEVDAISPKIDFSDMPKARELLMKVAHTSCGDYKISETLVNAFIAGGKNTHIDIKKSSDTKDHTKAPTNKFISTYLRLLTKYHVNDTVNNAYVYKVDTNSNDVRPSIYIIEGELTASNIEFLQMIVDESATLVNNVPVFILCHGIDGDVGDYIAALGEDRDDNIPSLVLGYCDGAVDSKREIYKNIALYTGCLTISNLDFISDSADDGIDSTELQKYCGHVDQIMLGRGRSVISNIHTENGNNKLFNEKVELLASLIDDASKGQDTTASTIGGYKSMLAMLKGTDVEIYLGGETPAVRGMRNCLAEDALRAIGSAIDHGCVTGYLSSYLYTTANSSIKTRRVDISKLDKHVIQSIHRLNKKIGRSIAKELPASTISTLSECLDTSILDLCYYGEVSDATKIGDYIACQMFTLTMTDKLSSFLSGSIYSFVNEYIISDSSIVDATRDKGYVYDVISQELVECISKDGIDISNVDVLDTLHTQKTIINTGLSIMSSIFSTHVFLSSLEQDKVYFNGERIIYDSDDYEFAGSKVDDK